MQNLAYNNWYWRYDNQELADPDLVTGLTLSLCDTCQIPYPNTQLQLVISEIITNAIEHGVLCLDSKLKDEPDGFDLYALERQKRLASLSNGWISVAIEQGANELLQIAVQDSGSGFDYRNFVSEAENEVISLHGRGLMIIRSLCKTVTHTGSGNCIVVEFDASVASANDLHNRKKAIAG